MQITRGILSFLVVVLLFICLFVRFVDVLSFHWLLCPHHRSLIKEAMAEAKEGNWVGRNRSSVVAFRLYFHK